LKRKFAKKLNSPPSDSGHVAGVRGKVDCWQVTGPQVKGDHGQVACGKGNSRQADSVCGKCNSWQVPITHDKGKGWLVVGACSEAYLSRPKKITGDINWFYKYNIL
jgi:hypothetical protein